MEHKARYLPWGSISKGKGIAAEGVGRAGERGGGL